MSAAEIIAWLKGLTNDQRAEVLYEIAKEYCIHCGRYHGDSLRRCQCWNDE